MLDIVCSPDLRLLNYLPPAYYYYLLHTIYYLLPTIYDLLPTTYHPLLIPTYYLLLTSYMNSN